MTRVDYAPAVRACTRYDCVTLNLPPHTHVLVPFPPERVVGRPYAATHLECADVDRVVVDWRAVAYEAWTGQRLPPPAGQLMLALTEEAGCG